ncbi:MAG: hypothetical protein AAF483_04320, partial [Planctomycetota bacterium]
LISQSVLRDQNASLQEMVLSSPLSLRGLLLGRYLGALGVGLVVASAIYMGLMMAPVLEWIGALPSEAVGPTPSAPK